MSHHLFRKRDLSPELRGHSAVKLIGLGGVGSIVARYAAVFLASMGQEVRLVLVDGDSFEYSNSSRMLFTAYGNKAVVLRDELLERFAETSLSLLAVEEFVTAENIGRLVQSGDLCLLCVDNHATRKILSDHCSQLDGVCLISGGNDGIGVDNSGVKRRGTFGNVQVYVGHNGKDLTPLITQNHPEIAFPQDKLPTDQSCTELVTSVPQILFANLAVASAMSNTLWLYLCGALHYGELAFDIADGLMRPVSVLQPMPAWNSLASTTQMTRGSLP